MKKILPIKTPVISGFPVTGHMLSILQNYNEVWPWVLNNYIQLFSAGYEINIDYFDINMENCPFLLCNIIDKRIILKNSSILNFIIDVIDNGYYLTFQLDTSQISKYNYATFHDPLIYGYDTDNQEIYFADHFRHGIYSFSSCSFDEMINATKGESINNLEERFKRDYDVFKLIKYDTTWCNYKIEISNDFEKRFDFLPMRVKDSFEDYIKGTATRNWFTRAPYLSFYEEEKHYFGMECYQLMKLLVEKNWEEKVMPLGLRHSFYVMYSQKIMQQKRILYMNQHNLLKNGEVHLNRWISMSNTMHHILLFIIKENASAKYKEQQKFTLLNEIEKLSKTELEAVIDFMNDIVL